MHTVIILNKHSSDLLKDFCFLYKPFDSIWLYLISIIPILWGIRLSAIKKLSGNAINVSSSQFLFTLIARVKYYFLFHSTIVA